MRAQTGSFPSMWPGRSPITPSPALSTRSGATTLQDETAPAQDSVRPTARRTPDPDRITCGSLGRSRAVAPPLTWAGLGPSPLPQTRKRAAANRSPALDSQDPASRARPWNGTGRPPPVARPESRPGCACLGNQTGRRSLEPVLPSGVNKPGLLGNDLQAKCRGLGVHLDDPNSFGSRTRVFSVPAAVGNGFLKGRVKDAFLGVKSPCAVLRPLQPLAP